MCCCRHLRAYTCSCMGKRQLDQLLRLGRISKPSEDLPSARRLRQPPVRADDTTSPQAALTLDSADALDRAVSDDALSSTVDILTKLQRHPDLFRLPRFKALRAAVYALVQPTHSFVARASEAITAGRWADAIVALHAMRLAGEVPKLGSVQRWVRDCDLAAGDDDAVGLRCIDAILRVASPEMICSFPTPGFHANDHPSPLLREPEWQGAPLQSVLPPPPEDAEVECVASKFFVLMREKASQRRPTNLHDMILYSCPEKTLSFMRPAAEASGTITRTNVPFAPESFFLSGVLSPAEAQWIVAVAEKVGFSPDVPCTGKKSILAHNFVWLCDVAFMENIFERCKKFLPPSIQGKALVGIQRRLRCYRYVPGAVYRAHVDGAWPPSGTNEKGEYLYDTSFGKVLSKLTFLIYLNEGFEGGWTTYFTPAFEEGHLKVTPVAPRIGCVMVFPHGETAGCLVHEGSAVTDGTKYIIRTEVLYDA